MPELHLVCRMEAVNDVLQFGDFFQDFNGEGEGWALCLEERGFTDILLFVHPNREIEIYSSRRRKLTAKRGSKIIRMLMQKGFAIIEPVSPFPDAEFVIPVPAEN